MAISINPGTGPVDRYSDGISYANAVENIKAFVTDLGEPASWNRTVTEEANDYGEGRWCFTVVAPDGSTHEVQMPGAPLDAVRFMDAGDQNIWNFPRLYVDDSSWVWCFALGACERDEEDED